MTQRHSRLLTLLGAAALLASSLVAQAQTTQPLVRQENLVYKGSFRLPTVSGNGFNYGGTAISYNAANNSLFVVGHVYDQEMAEVSIPALGGTATVLQALRDPVGGKLGNIGGTGSRRLGGSLVYNNRLYVTGFVFYDADNAQRTSHFNRALSLTDSTVNGPISVGSQGAGFYSGYMGTIPAEWRSLFGGPALTGNCCLSIISRTSYGPAVSVFNPEATGASATSLVHYTSDHQTLGSYGASGIHPVFNGTTRITGVVFPNGTASVLFFGMTGVGNYCYGEAAECNDPSNNSKGEHAYPYKAYVWAYNANDLLAVKNGTRQPYSVTPYQTFELSEPTNVVVDFGIGGAAYDPGTNRVYVIKKGTDSSPTVYVYEITNGAAVVRPNSPTAVSAQ
jgi:hypothetical protein